MTIELARHYVCNGAAVLDQSYHGWERKIDLSTLDVQSLINCPLGQVYGDFGLGLLATQFYYARTAGHFGFCGFTRDGDQQTTFEELNQAWTELIKQRFDLDILSDTMEDDLK